jgi:aconitate hydratase
VVGKFVEFFGDGRRLADAARPRHPRQHGARVRRHDGLLSARRETAAYLAATGRSAAEVDAFRRYFRPRACSACRAAGDIDYSRTAELDLDEVVPAWPAPSRPQDRIALPDLKARFAQLLSAPAAERRLWPRRRAGPAARAGGQRAPPGPWRRADRRHHLLHQHLQPRRDAGRRPAGPQGGGARAAGGHAHIKTSLAPGSRVVTDYLGRPACSSRWRHWAFGWWPMAAPPASATPGRWTESGGAGV